MARRAALGAALAAIALARATARARMVEGPFPSWIILAGDASADQALHDYAHAEPTADSCWNGDALLLIGEYPAAIQQKPILMIRWLPLALTK